MRLRAGDFFGWRGKLSRAQYFTIGAAAFCLKYGVDTVLARGIFHQSWKYVNYWRSPFEVTYVQDLPRADARFLLTMLLAALPFLWLGIVCTINRLRDARLHWGWMFFFFVPLVNLGLFTALCIFPSRDNPDTEYPAASRAAEEVGQNRSGRFGAAALAVFGTAIAGLLFTILSTKALGSYGWGLFVALPFSMGFISVLIYEWSEPRALGDSLAACIVSQLLFGCMLLAFAFEGAICILMALPIGVVLAIMGGCLAHTCRRGRMAAQRPAALSVVLLLVPGVLGTEHFAKPAPPEYRVVSSVEIAAPPEVVWQKVIAFAQIPEPREWYFRAGVAYPIRAEIMGRGAGAERHCVFSTGAFVEPIEVWDEPRLLKFSVSANPPPLNELSPYRHIEPPHLHGYFASDEGQFRLIALSDGGTLLEGTTWYHNRIWPAAYWRLWSDAIIHRIHLRVLRHIKAVSEADESRARGAGAKGSSRN